MNVDARSELRPHPAGGPAPAVSISVEVEERGEGRLRVRYVVLGEVRGLRVPEPATPARTDGLWNHTCFELFVRDGPGAPGYVEFNFSPSGQWAAYRFESYRRPAGRVEQPDVAITVSRSTERLELRAECRVPGPSHGVRAVGLTAVLEDGRGERSHWALAHPASTPDFHRSEGFVSRIGSKR